MSPFARLVCLLALPAFCAEPNLDSVLKAVESRYNRAKSLQVVFHEEYTPTGRPRRTESGTLQLRKPGKMRWDYSQPKGKLFLGDGKYLWLYVPADNRVEKMKMQESEDMRAPLAFLLGKLNFQKEFRNIQGRPDGAGGTLVTAEPKSDSLPYSAVEFAVSPDNVIRRVKVTGFDKSVLDFTFDQEQMNPPIDAALFRMEVPKGAQVVEPGQ